MDEIIPMGMSGKEQAFKVNGVLIIYDHDRHKVKQCNVCRNSCDHEHIIGWYVEDKENYINWMSMIAWVWNFDDGGFPYNFRSRIHGLWYELTNGMIDRSNKIHREMLMVTDTLRSVVGNAPKKWFYGEIDHYDTKHLKFTLTDKKYDYGGVISGMMMPPKQKLVTLSDKEYKRKTEEWLISVDQSRKEYHEKKMLWLNEMMEIVNKYLDTMKFDEIVHLACMPVPMEIDESKLIHRWTQARNNGINNILLTTGVDDK